MTLERPFVYSNFSFGEIVISSILTLAGVTMILAGLYDIVGILNAILILIATAINYFGGLSLNAGHFTNQGGMMGLFLMPVGYLALLGAAQILSSSLYEARFWSQEDTLFCKQLLRLPIHKLPRLRVTAPPPIWKLLRSEVDRFEVTQRITVSKYKGQTRETTFYQVTAFYHTGAASPLLWIEPMQAAKAQGVCDQLNAWLDGDRP